MAKNAAKPPAPTERPVIHLELHTGDLSGALAFYGAVCGWRPERIRAGDGSYLTLGIGGRVGGGVVEHRQRGSLWVPYVAVPDLDRATERARGLGGEVVLERSGPHGRRSVVVSPEGGEVAFWQPHAQDCGDGAVAPGK